MPGFWWGVACSLTTRTCHAGQQRLQHEKRQL
jgi:hypothetical protein